MFYTIARTSIINPIKLFKKKNPPRIWPFYLSPEEVENMLALSYNGNYANRY